MSAGRAGARFRRRPGVVSGVKTTGRLRGEAEYSPAVPGHSEFNICTQNCSKSILLYLGCVRLQNACLSQGRSQTFCKGCPKLFLKGGNTQIKKTQSRFQNSRWSLQLIPAVLRNTELHFHVIMAKNDPNNMLNAGPNLLFSSWKQSLPNSKS